MDDSRAQSANALVVESGVLLMKSRRVDGATERVTTAFGR